MPTRLQRSIALCGVLALVSLGSCGSGDDEACGPITRERLDPAYLVHVLGDDPEIQYSTDPPTSGPHQSGPAIDGVAAEPLPRPVQVGLLERGDVLLQHSADLPADQVARLESLAGTGVVVAPAIDLPSPVIATAWTYKLRCSAVDESALSTFIADRAGKGPEG